MSSMFLLWFSLAQVGVAPHVTAKVTLGVDVLLEDEIALVKGKRVGLVTNASGVDGQLMSTRVRLAKDKRLNLVQLYSPEHGLDGAAPAGKALKDTIDPRTGLPVQSLFGGQKAPSLASLKKLDVLVFDIQGVGSRTYTYASTMGESMVRAKEAGIPFVVLDRPNINEGYGTTSPFERIGAEFVDPFAFTKAMNDAGLAGVSFIPVSYRPSYSRFRDKHLLGAQLVITEATDFKPLRTALTILTVLEKLYPGKTIFKNNWFFNAIWGDPKVKSEVRAGKSPQEIEARWAADLQVFSQQRSKVLLYGE
jgi:uncharacterized protein YbbC (DUF1343 family)